MYALMHAFCVQAFAFVEIFASAQQCGCDTAQHVEAVVFENIWAEAAASAYAEACAGTIPAPPLLNARLVLSTCAYTVLASATCKGPGFTKELVGGTTPNFAGVAQGRPSSLHVCALTQLHSTTLLCTLDS